MEVIMRYLLSTGVSVFAAILATMGPAAAEKVCKDFVTATGSAAALSSAAPKKARSAWAREVTARYGEYWNDWEKAADKNDQANCGKAYKYLHRCEARARPCAEQPTGQSGGDEPNSASCTTIGNLSRKCDDLIVQVQLRLQAAGCSPGSVDGVNGGSTRDAIRCYQRKKGLPANGELNPETAKSLKLS
jgi:hypothetical protein